VSSSKFKLRCKWTKFRVDLDKIGENIQFENKILKLLTKINQFFIVSSLPETYFHQFCLNQLCQLVLYEHVKSPNHFKLWLYAGPLKEPLPGGMKTDRLLGPLAS